MNKKELAKLLLKHPLIKQIKESKGIDKKDFNRILAEEILKEQGEDYDKINAALDLDVNTLKSEELKDAFSTLVSAIRVLLRFNDPTAEEDKKTIQTKKEQVLKMMKEFETMTQVSDKTETHEDDKITATAVTDVAASLETAAKTGTPESIAQAVNDAEETTNQAADGVKQVASSEQDGTQDNQQAVATKGWRNAKKEVLRNLKEKAITLEQVKASLKSPEDFKQIWGIKGNVEGKMKQVEDLFNSKYIQEKLKELSSKVSQENVKDASLLDQATQDSIASLVATVGAYNEYLNTNPEIKIPPLQQKIESGDIFSGEIPKSEEEFKQQFIDPSDELSGNLGDSGGINPEDENTQETVLETFFKKHNLGSIEEFTIFRNETFKEAFIQALIDAASSKVGDKADQINNVDSGGLEEALSGIFLEEEGEQNQDNNQNDENSGPINKDEAAAAAEQLQKLQAAVDAAKLQIKVQELWDASQEQVKTSDVEEEGEVPTQEEAQQQGQEAAKEDASRENAGYAEIYSELLPEMNIFFSAPGEKELGFMEQFLLKRQAAQLWSLIGGLQKILQTDEMKAFTRQGEKTAAGVEDQTSPEQDGQNLQEQEEGEVTISEEDQVSIKTDLIAFLKSLRALKALVSSYEKNMTRVSVDPALDGSSLKERISEMLPRTQDSIAKIYERIHEAFKKATELKAQEQKPETQNQEPPQGQGGEETVEEMAILEALEGIILEDADREGKIQLVDGIYDQMRAIFQPEQDPSNSVGLQGMMSKGDKTGAESEARKMLDLAKKEEFINLFPGGMLGEGGVPVTVKEASDALSKLITGMVEIMKDVIMLAKGETIPQPKLNVILGKLKEIADTIQRFFKVPSKINKEKAKEMEDEDLKNPENQSITNTPAENKSIEGSEDESGNESYDINKFTWYLKNENQNLTKISEELGNNLEAAALLSLLSLSFFKIKQGDDSSEDTPPMQEQDENLGKIFKPINSFLITKFGRGDTDLQSSPKKLREFLKLLYNKDQNLKETVIDLSSALESLNPNQIMAINLQLTMLREKAKKGNVSLPGIDDLNKLLIDYKKIINALSQKDSNEEHSSSVEESLKPIILKMLNEHYSHKF